MYDLELYLEKQNISRKKRAYTYLYHILSKTNWDTNPSIKDVIEETARYFHRTSNWIYDSIRISTKRLAKDIIIDYIGLYGIKHIYTILDKHTLPNFNIKDSLSYLDCVHMRKFFERHKSNLPNNITTSKGFLYVSYLKDRDKFTNADKYL